MSEDIDVVDVSKIGTESTGTIEVGKWATDREAPDSTLLILEIEEIPANEKVIFETPEGDADITVANFKENKNYDSTAHIAHAIYKNKIKEACGERCSSQDVVRKYNEGKIKDRLVYTYPIPRLNPQ